MAITLNIDIKKRQPLASDLDEIYSGSQNIDRVCFTFDEEWTGFTKKAVFCSSSKDCFFTLLDTGDSAIVPAAAVEKAGSLFIGVIGEKADQRISSGLLRFQIGRGASC